MFCDVMCLLSSSIEHNKLESLLGEATAFLLDCRHNDTGNRLRPHLTFLVCLPTDLASSRLSSASATADGEAGSSNRQQEDTDVRVSSWS